jgi:putative Ca2+/H+ antiporter (TMEM165/GDT1 family)
VPKESALAAALQTFGVIFLAEMADKTQLMTVCQAAKFQKPLWVFVGAASALLVVTLIGVAFGSLISKFIPPHRMKQIAGLVFIGLGAYMLLKRS